MKTNKQIFRKGVLLENVQLAKYLEELAAEQTISINSKKTTYPIKELKEDFKFITKVYTLLNEHIKFTQGRSIYLQILCKVHKNNLEF